MSHRRIRLVAIVSVWVVMSMLCVGAQGALAYNVGHDGADPVHEIIVGYGLLLYSNSEMDSYRDTIKEGAKQEDLIDLVDDVDWGSEDFCVTQTHFWDGDLGPNDKVDNVAACGFEVRNSWQKARILWGMALGRYRAGDKAAAYEYLGHVAHLLADQSVPAHAHEDAHPEGDIYEEWMDSYWAALGGTEGNALINEGPVQIPDDITFGPYAQDDPIGPLYYLFYTVNQIGDYFPSDGVDGDDSLIPANGSWPANIYFTLPVVDKSDLDEGDDNTAMLETIREHSYKYAIRATAALFELFWQEVSSASALTVVIDQVLELNDTEGDVAGDHADFYIEVEIGGFEYRNEGEQDENEDHIYPGWAFGRNVGVTGDILVVMQLFDEDDLTADDPSPIDPVEGRTDLDFWVNLDTGVIREWENPDIVLGNCGDQLVSAGHENDDDRSKIWFRVLLPNIPPTAYAGYDQWVNEGDLVTLNGTFTDPNEEDTHTFLWHLEDSENGQAASDSTTQTLTFTPNDNGEYLFSFTVTDNYGASDTDELVVTSANVPPVATIDSLTDELGAEIGVDVPVALVGLVVELGGSFTDVGTADTHEALIDWGGFVIDEYAAFDFFSDSTGGVTGVISHTHVYTVPNLYTIMLLVTDDDYGLSVDHTDIEIVDAAGAIAAVVERLTSLADNPDIQAALDKLQGNNGGAANNGAIDKLEQENLNAALEKIKQALDYLEAAEAADPNLDLSYDKGLLALAAKSVAVGAIADATAVADKPNELKKIQAAEDLVAEGDALLTVPDYVAAVDSYQEAVREVQGML